ncbi:mitochondrial ATP-independent inner membrane protease subunit 1b-like [Amaranthus tricolor]|uniref:mitochondrial ATP-independent inner membrane protease subunit 1b-like n=1 Tax=Amaranthus tricolor TaxID=29722 RepID=UPI00258F36F7|nr:mitochondrial ATP-independent inner membrane protease subunit 1b-like [Amaranthus tricolor]
MVQWLSFVKEASNTSMAIVKFFCVLHVTRTYLLDVSYATGPSMLPTLNIEGDALLIDRISPRFRKVIPGDVVIVCSPENPRKLVTKRLIAKEDDSVTFLVDPKNSDKCKTVVVPKGHVWVQGDNIYASRDSRDFGPVPYGLIYGKVFWRIWPVKHFGRL